MLEIPIWAYLVICSLFTALGWSLRGLSDHGIYTSKEAYDELSHLASVMAKKLDEEGIAVRFDEEFQ